MFAHFTIAGQCRHDVFMPQILAPGLELFTVTAALFSQLGEGVSEAMRVVVGQAGVFECVSEDSADWLGGLPVFSLEASGLEL